jgi:hypothetical protein
MLGTSFARFVPDWQRPSLRSGRTAPRACVQDLTM